jgi:hypothetical protein
MGYYMRFILSDARPVSLAILEDALREQDPNYKLLPDQVPDIGELFYASQRLALLEINRADEEIFSDDLTEFKDLVGSGREPKARLVLDVLNQASAIIAVEAFWDEGQADSTLMKLEPLWDWLFANRNGILQADGEGFYNVDDLILERKFML